MERRDFVGWRDCTPLQDGGVMKRIIREGNASAGVAPKGFCIKCNYDAYIEGGWFDGKFIATTRDRGEHDGDYQFMCGDEHEAVKDGWVIKGLSYACESAHRNERFECIISAEYAFGALGSRHPKVPPNTSLRYEVDMLTWMPALQNEKSMLDMTGDCAHLLSEHIPLTLDLFVSHMLLVLGKERMENAHMLKQSANEHFFDGQPDEAQRRYWKAGTLMQAPARAELRIAPCVPIARA